MKLLSVILAFACTSVLAQDFETVNSIEITTTPPKSYVVNASGVIKAGVTISGATKAFFLRANAQAAPTISQNKNFVRTETVLVENILTSDAVADLTTSQKTTSFAYVDGLGSAIQVVEMKASPGHNDIVKAMEYDNLGRIWKEYSSYSANGNGVYRGTFSSEAASFYGGTQGVAYDPSRPFTEHKYEASSINRETETYGPGGDWFANSRKSTVTTKVDNGGSIKLWAYVDENTALTSTFYGPGQLTIKETVNEDNFATREYIDKKGRVILKRIQESGDFINAPTLVTWVDTYYIYDYRGNLVVVLPPMANANFAEYTSANATDKQNFLNRWAFRYTYDGLNRIIIKKIPGGGSTYFVYDKWDRIVLTRESAWPANQWLFTKYDAMSRPILSGIYNTAVTHTNLQTAAMTVATGRYETATPSAAVGYTLTSSFPTSGITEANVNTILYYDDYSFLVTGWDAERATSSYDFASDTGFPTDVITTAKGQKTGSKVRVLGTTTWMNEVLRYDKKYRVLQAFKENYIGGVDRVTSAYDFVGKTIKALSTHASTYASLAVLKEFFYDDAGRLTKTYQTTGTGARVLLSSNRYNEIGQLVEKNLHSTDDGTSFLQSVDYKYNIRGWTTNINDGALAADPQDNNADLYGMDLVYNQEFVNINGSNTAKAYAGNISAIRWSSNNFNDPQLARVYGYTYDQMGRLKDAKYASKTGSLWTDKVDGYNESMTYDKNGNILTLLRNSVFGGSVKLIDDLRYDYGTTGSNQLTSVDDYSLYYNKNDNNPDAGFVELTQYKKQGLTSPEYQYDVSGRLVTDANKAITTNIVYNYLNLPETVVLNGNTIQYTYDASGTKLRQRVTTGSVITTDYVSGIQYKDNQLQFVGTEEGRVVKNGSAYDYEYFIKDHLGNVRVSFGYTKQVKAYKATLEQERDQKETTDFNNISRATAFNITPKNAETPNPVYSASLSGAVGPAKKAFTVKQGDKISLEAFARYTGTVNTTKVTAAVLAGLVTGSYGLAATGETATAYNAVNGGVLAEPTNNNTGAPKAYLCYFLFSSDYTWRQFGYHAISTVASTTFERLAHEITVNFPAQVTSQQGILYAYVVNETIGTPVSFDDFKVVHQKIDPGLQVLQSNEYYPFGLTYNSFQRESSVKQDYLYNGKELQDELGLGWLDYGARMYMSDIGRWGVIDPLSDKMRRHSPYNYVFNNPMRFIDPDGMGPNDYYYGMVNGKFTYLGNDGVGTEIRYVREENVNNVKSKLSGEKTTEENRVAAQSKSAVVIVENESIQDDIQAMADHSRSDQREHMAQIVMDIDSEQPRIFSIEGNSGENSTTEFPYSTLDGETFTADGQYLLLAGIHGHPESDDPLTQTNRTMSPLDVTAATNSGVPVYGIDAMNGWTGSRQSIHRVTPDGKIKNYVGSSRGTSNTGFDIVNQALKIITGQSIK